MLTYSTNPVTDADRYIAACAYEEAIREARINAIKEDTLTRFRKGDFSRIYEAMDNDEAVMRDIAQVVRRSALRGDKEDFAAIDKAAQVYAEIYCEK